MSIPTKNTTAEEAHCERRLTLADLASHYGVSLWAAREWLRAGMPHERLGARTVRVRLSQVREWLAERGVK